MTKKIVVSANGNKSAAVTYERGPEGPEGLEGLIGNDGPKGLRGDAGIAGVVGQQGPEGREGVRGPTGEVGPTGPENPDMYLGHFSAARALRLARGKHNNAKKPGLLRAISDKANRTEIVEDWLNLTTNGWKQSVANQYKVGGFGLLPTAATNQYILLPLEWEDDDYGFIEGQFNYAINGSNDDLFVGLQFNNQNVPTTVTPPNVIALGFDTNHTWFAYTSTGSPTFTPQRNGQPLQFEGAADAQGVQTHGPYSFRITITETTVSFHIQHLQLNYSSANAQFDRIDPVTGEKWNPTGFAIKMGDSRINSGILNLPNHAVYGVRVVKGALGRVPTKVRAADGATLATFSSYPLSILQKSPVVADPDLWRISIPADYDEQRGAPLFVFMHGSISGWKDSLWQDQRAYDLAWGLSSARSPISQVLWPFLNPSAIILTLDDGSKGDGSSLGDRWGNQKSLDNYAAAIKWVRERFHTTHTFLSGQSMGGVTALNGVARGVFTEIDGIIGNGLAYDMHRIGVDGSGAQKTSFKTAYGINGNITFPVSNEVLTKTAGYRPEDHPVHAFAGVPMLLLAGVADALNYHHSFSLKNRYEQYTPIEFIFAVNPNGSKAAHVAQGEQGAYIVQWIQEIIDRGNKTY